MCVSYKEMAPMRKTMGELNYVCPFLTLNSISREVTLFSLGKLRSCAKEQDS